MCIRDRVRITFSAEEGPEFVIFISKVISVPGSTGLGNAVF